MELHLSNDEVVGSSPTGFANCKIVAQLAERENVSSILVAVFFTVKSEK
jgi:hypothetical protein